MVIPVRGFFVASVPVRVGIIIPTVRGSRFCLAGGHSSLQGVCRGCVRRKSLITNDKRAVCRAAGGQRVFLRINLLREFLGEHIGGYPPYITYSRSLRYFTPTPCKLLYILYI